MLTKTKCEFWVIMCDKTPAFPGPRELPFLICNGDKCDCELKITNPFDPEVKTFNNACGAQLFINDLKKKEWFTTPGIKNDDLEHLFPFKVECTVRVASLAEIRGWADNMPPIEPGVPIPKAQDKVETVDTYFSKFKQIKVKYFDMDGTPRTDKLNVSQFVPWTLQKNGDECLCKKKRCIFLGPESRLVEDPSTARLIANSRFVKEAEYQRLLKIHKKLKLHPEKFLKKKEMTHDHSQNNAINNGGGSSDTAGHCSVETNQA